MENGFLMFITLISNIKRLEGGKVITLLFLSIIYIYTYIYVYNYPYILFQKLRLQVK